jgi:hypothetical protein
VLVDQVLVDGRGVALEAQLRFDEGAVGLAMRDSGGDCGDGGGSQRGRWPGWGNLSCRVGGHPGGVWRLRGVASLVGTDRLAINAGDAFNLALTGLGFEQRPNGCL